MNNTFELDILDKKTRFREACDKIRWTDGDVGKDEMYRLMAETLNELDFIPDEWM